MIYRLFLLALCFLWACSASSNRDQRTRGSSMGDGSVGDASPGSFIDLADIVGGGDGSGTGTDQGIDMLTGAATATHGSAFDCPVNSFVEADNGFVDGVFCPDGGEQEDEEIVVSSEGTTVTGVPDWESLFFTENTWDHIWNGRSKDVVTSTTGSEIGAHANKGITFDLDAIESAHGGREVARFEGGAGIGSRDPNQDENKVSFQVYVDGDLVFEKVGAQERDSLFPISVPIASGARFLTLIASSAGDIQSDWSYWANPVLLFAD
ncbi:MAG: NPCBM/NEW2 domain-containing protein [Myxococcales bacterium]|nr:NPCBM/NEW2 domain-containing protein [Myxococcales bacterium]